MRRARRQTIRRGNLSGRQRRRLRVLVARIQSRPSSRGAASVRDVRRLSEAGIVVAVVSKYRPWSAQPMAEVTAFLSVEAARREFKHRLPGRLR